MSNRPRKRNGRENRGPYTPRMKQLKVLERHMSGQSNRKIAREERLDRETVKRITDRILSQEELVRLTAACQSRFLSFVPKALDVYEKGLNSADERHAAAIATKVLEGTHISGGPGLQGTIEESITRKGSRDLPILPEFGEVTRFSSYDFYPGVDEPRRPTDPEEIRRLLEGKLREVEARPEKSERTEKTRRTLEELLRFWEGECRLKANGPKV